MAQSVRDDTGNDAVGSKGDVTATATTETTLVHESSLARTHLVQSHITIRLLTIRFIAHENVVEGLQNRMGVSYPCSVGS